MLECEAVEYEEEETAPLEKLVVVLLLDECILRPPSANCTRR